MPKGIPKSGINKGWFKEGTTVNLGRKRLDMIGNTYGYPKGHKSWNTGLKNANPVRERLLKTGEYYSLHYWVKKQLGRPLKCWRCFTVTAKRYHWANISGEYKKKTEDWMRLCAPCHSRFDKTNERLKEVWLKR